ncbi:MAG: hypothetical protein RL434_2318 [Pseudomonadota bacterium]|jgi:hypothetical protein
MRASALLFAILAASFKSAIATDLTSYPTGLLGPVSRVATTLPSGVWQCRFSGSIDYGVGGFTEYVATARLVLDGVKDQENFGHFLPGSSMYYTYRFSSNLAPLLTGSCLHKMDLVDSKYTMNRVGQGIIRTTTLMGAGNACGPYSSQWTFLLDASASNAWGAIDDTSQNNGLPGHLGEGQCRRL